MASYHWSAQIIGRSDGRSALRVAAYRAGQDIRDFRNGEVHAFGRRSGVAWTAVMLPMGASPALADRETLWNAVEAIEVREDAQLAREINLALPFELTLDQQIPLLMRYVEEQFIARGMIADVAIHLPRPGKGEDVRNVHAHIMLTLRKGEPEGLARVKTREWNSRQLIGVWRESWAVAANQALERYGYVERIDHRSFAARRAEALQQGDARRAQQFDRLPEVHLGSDAIALMRKAAFARDRKPNAAHVPVQVRDNAQRIDRNAKVAWYRHAVVSAVDAGRARQTVRCAEVQQPTASQKIMSEVIAALHQHKAATPQVRISGADIAFALYRMGLLDYERLQTTLDLIAAEAELKRASARKTEFWHQTHGLTVRRSGGRRRGRANDPSGLQSSSGQST